MVAHQTSRSLARYNASGVGPLADGASTSLFVDQYGNLLTSQGTLSAGEDLVNNRQIVEERWQYKEVESTGTSNNIQVSIKSGVFHGFIVGDIGGGGYFIIKDSPDGTGSNTILPYVPSQYSAGQLIQFDVPFTTGLWIQQNNTTGTQPIKFVILYRENAS